MGDGRQDLYPYPVRAPVQSRLDKLRAELLENKARRELSGMMLKPILQLVMVAVMVKCDWFLKACGCTDKPCIHSFMDPGELIQAGLLVKADKKPRGAESRCNENYDDLIDMAELLEAED